MTRLYPQGINNAWVGRGPEFHCYKLNAKEAREKPKRRAEKALWGLFSSPYIS